jgi:hypothetical protein
MEKSVFEPRLSQQVSIQLEQPHPPVRRQSMYKLTPTNYSILGHIYAQRLPRTVPHHSTVLLLSSGNLCSDSIPKS